MPFNNIWNAKHLFFSITAGLFGSALFVWGAAAQTSDLVSRNAFRVCADPANYPQSAEDGSGFENEIAELMADALELPLEYFWFPMSTGFVRNSLAANQCDVIIGFSAGHELVLNSNPYYTSTFIIVSKKGGEFEAVDHLADPALKEARIGLIAGVAPATHLVKYDLMGNVVPYQLFADRRMMNPNQQMLDALENGELDVAILWGPIGGPLVKNQFEDLNVIPLLKEEGQPVLFARITMGVRQGEVEWKRALNSQIRRNQDAIDGILRERGVPILKENGKELKAE